MTAVRAVLDNARMPPSNPKDSPWYSTPTAARKRKPIGITLSDEAQERLEKMAKARKQSRSAVVEALVMGAPLRCPSPTSIDGKEEP